LFGHSHTVRMVNMTITYPNGAAFEAILLSRGNDTLRVAVQGEDEARTFTLISGTWVSEDCEPVRIEFAWQRRGQSPVPAEADCICSQELASRLIPMLLVDSKEEEVIDNMLWASSAEGQLERIPRSQPDFGKPVC
jgi:hypothetical protein